MNETVLIAIDSVTIRSLVKQNLSKSGFNCMEAEDGEKALENIYKYSPKAVILWSELPVINAESLCRILKNTEELKEIALCIIMADEENADIFTLQNLNPDIITTTQKITGEEFSEEIKNIISKKNIPEILEQNLSKEKLLSVTTKAYSRELFSLYLIKSAWEENRDLSDINQIIKNMEKILNSITSYNALAIIVNTPEINEFYKTDFGLSPQELETFKKICHKDFAERIYSRKEFNWEKSNCIAEEKNEVQKSTGIKLSSYAIFPAEKNKNSSFTVHIAKDENIYGESFDSEKIEIFVEIYSNLIEKALSFKKLKLSEEKIHSAFSRFLPEKIIDDIVENSEFSNVSIGEQRKVAILIADIRSFTTLSEKNSPEKIVSFLNRYFSRMGQIIKKHGGTIDKFMGDAIMALFGATESYLDNGDRAVMTALEMNDIINEIDISDLTVPEGYKLTVGFGINYGNPIVGSIGSENKKEFTVIGDDVNIASRVESLTKQYGCPIIVTESVKNGISDEHYPGLVIRHLDNVRVKGKSNVTKIYEITKDKNKYSEIFLSSYQKALHQQILGNFNGALDYLHIAERENQEDLATKLLSKRCSEFISKKPEDWNGAITLTQK